MKRHDNNEFCRENSKPRRESRITTCYAESFNLLSNQLFGKSWRRKTRQRIDFHCNHEEADSKMFAYIKFLYDICLNRTIVSPDSDVGVISMYQGVTNFTFFDALWFKTGIRWRYIPMQVLASERGLSICCLLPVMHAGCESVSSFYILERW